MMELGRERVHGWCFTWNGSELPDMLECEAEKLNETQVKSGRDAYGVGTGFFYDKGKALRHMRGYLAGLGEQHRAAVELIGRRVLEIDGELGA